MTAHAKPTQTAEILRHLEVHGSITQMDAIRHFKCTRLAPRILELRSAGHAITTTMEGEGRSRYARYSLVLTPQLA